MRDHVLDPSIATSPSKATVAPVGLTARVLDYDPRRFKELTRTEVLEDALIASLNRADEISKLSFAELLDTAARIIARR